MVKYTEGFEFSGQKKFLAMRELQKKFELFRKQQEFCEHKGRDRE